MFHLISLSATTSRPRVDVIEDVKDAVLAADGWIAEFRVQEQIGATVVFSVPEYALTGLHSMLARQLDIVGEVPEGISNRETMGTLALTFLRN